MTEEYNSRWDRCPNWQEEFVSPGLLEALNNPRKEKDVREERLSMWDVIKRGVGK